ncbi:MAG: hypothetical protein WD557_06430 [Dehalococcoidia bacterium]
MSERLTWEEIVARYPDEWVALEDIEDDEFINVLSAVVIAHSGDHDEVWGALEKSAAAHAGIDFTGAELPDPGFVYAL